MTQDQGGWPDCRIARLPHPNDGRAGRNGTVFDGPEGEKLHAAEVKRFFVDKGNRLVKDPQTGLWVDPLAK